jgi:hypothetical protein
LAYIYFLKLIEGDVIIDWDLKSPIQPIETKKINKTIPVLERVEKFFIYGFV